MKKINLEVGSVSKDIMYSDLVAIDSKEQVIMLGGLRIKQLSDDGKPMDLKCTFNEEKGEVRTIKFGFLS